MAQHACVSLRFRFSAVAGHPHAYIDLHWNQHEYWSRARLPVWQIVHSPFITAGEAICGLKAELCHKAMRNRFCIASFLWGSHSVVHSLMKLLYKHTISGFVDVIWYEPCIGVYHSNEYCYIYLISHIVAYKHSLHFLSVTHPQY